jgi:hypothetical protein
LDLSQGKRGIYWAFGVPNFASTVNSRELISVLKRVNLRKLNYRYDRDNINILTALLRKSVIHVCLENGLKVNSTGDLYFPKGVVENNKLAFTRYDGKKISIKAVGERNFRFKVKNKYFHEKSTYHISPQFRCFYDLFGPPIIRLKIGVYWTDANGESIEPSKSFRKRKALCKNWWNYEWLSRTLAVFQFIGNGEDERTLFQSVTGKLRIGLKPLTFNCDYGIDEFALKMIDEEENEDGELEEISIGGEEMSPDADES